MSYKIEWCWGISYLPLHTLNLRTTSESMRRLRRYAWRTSRDPGFLRLPGSLFRYVRLQAAEGQPRQISESLGRIPPVPTRAEAVLANGNSLCQGFLQLSTAEALLRELDRCRETVLQIPITQTGYHSFSTSSSASPQFGILQKIFVIFLTIKVMTSVPSVNNGPNHSQMHF